MSFQQQQQKHHPIIDKSHNRYLPKKEADVFKSTLKFYECKQYKKGCKSADVILKKYPDHGETLCMKGLIVHYLGRNKNKEESVELVKRGLMNDMRSHVCWHIYGLLHRSERCYTEAIKAYKQALKIDPSNLQILRDLSLLQIQMRDMHGFAHTRNTILTLNSNQKINWIAYALGKHLSGDPEAAIHVMDAYVGTLDSYDTDLQRCFESSELALYRNSLLSELPDNWQNALDHLIKCQDVVMDVTSWGKAMGYYQLMLGMHDEALTTYMKLWKRGCTEDYTIHSGCMCAALHMGNDICRQALQLRGTGTLATMMALSYEQRQLLADKYTLEWKQLYPTSQAMERIPLSLLDGEAYIRALDDYVRKRIVRGVPSLASDLAGLLWVEAEDGSYVLALDHMDVRLHPRYVMIGELIDMYFESLCFEATFPSQKDVLRRLMDREEDGYDADGDDEYDDENSSGKEEDKNENNHPVDQHEEEEIHHGNGKQCKHPHVHHDDDQHHHENENKYKVMVYSDPDPYAYHATTTTNSSSLIVIGPESLQPRSTLQWTYYLRSVWYELGGSYGQALELAEQCLVHTPTAVDAYELKGRLLHAAGDFDTAASVLDQGRALDPSDRYINNQTTLYYLRANKEDVALERMSLFMKDNHGVGGPEQNIVDMQCTWYELELAACWARKGQWGKNLKQYLQVIRHFEAFHDDQFDFHAYSLRKVTLRSYVQMLRWQDNLWGHDFYCAAAEGIIRTYMYLHDHPAFLQHADSVASDASTSMTPAERKKAKNKARKQKNLLEKQKKKQQQQRETTAMDHNEFEHHGPNQNQNSASKSNIKKKGGNSHNHNQAASCHKDNDPDGHELLKLDAMAEAAKYSATLARHAPHRHSTWTLRYDVAMLRGKKLLALQALFKSKVGDPHHSELFDRIVHFAQNRHCITHTGGILEDDSEHPDVTKMLNYGMEQLLSPHASLKAFVKHAAVLVKADPMAPLKMRVSVCRAYTICLCGSVEEAALLIIDGRTEGRGVCVDVCRDALRCLKRLGDEGKEWFAIWEGWIQARYPLAFGQQEESSD